MPRRDRDHGRRLRDPGRARAAGTGLGQPQRVRRGREAVHQAQVDLAGGHRLDDPVPRGHPQPDVQQGRLGADGGQGRGHRGGPGQRGEPDDEPAGRGERAGARGFQAYEDAQAVRNPIASA